VVSVYRPERGVRTKKIKERAKAIGSGFLVIEVKLSKVLFLEEVPLVSVGWSRRILQVNNIGKGSWMNGP